MRLLLKVVLLVAVIAVSLVGSAQGIDVVVTTSPAAPFCCGLASVSFTSIIQISNPEPAFFNQPYHWEVWNGTSNCNPWTYRFSPLGTEYSGANIELGIFRIFFQNWGSVECEVAARSYTFARVGGYGLLPYVGVGYTSFCHQPCTCP